MPGIITTETPLHHAAYWGKTEAAALLIQKGAKVNARDENLETPLHYAAEDQADVAALLIQKGANVNARDNYQETPLHHAASRGMTGIAALLIQKGAKVNARNEDQWTPLHHAAFAGNIRGRCIAYSERRKRKCQGRKPKDAAALGRFCGQHRGCGIAH